MTRLTITTLLCTLFLGVLAAHAQEENKGIFPDKNLEKAVRKYVFEKRNNEEPLTVADVENISTLVAQRSDIASLAGMANYRSLALLDLEGNAISDLGPIKDLKNIQSLNVASNKVSDLAPVAGLTALQYLHLAGNEVSDLAPLAGLENLRAL